MKLSVVIITFNEEKNIGRCIDSVKPVADEIIVLDSLSTDNTLEIARARGADVHQHSFLGYVEQKNRALALASNDFVLCLDADEALDKLLVDSIIHIKMHAVKPAVYTMNRCTNYCGRFIRHGSWYPDRKIRLFNRTIAQWGGVNPHDKVILHKLQPIIRLKGDILHYSYHSIEEHIQQNNKFSTISAETLYESGKTTNMIKMILHPVWAFILGYLLRLGFLDGFYGLVIAWNVSHLSFLKHAKLYKKQHAVSTP